ncbi:MAG: hypothetical protein QMB02_00010 [Rhodospirillales bacterium]|jgi:hypothetical protein
MAGNIFSRVLLSIFIDKNARKKLDEIQAAKNCTLKKSIAPAKANKKSADNDDLDVLPETLVQQAIDSASAELERKKNLPPGRQALIEQALSIHDQKTKLLDDLPKEQREKLVVMAMHAFGSSFDEKADADAKKPKKKHKRP